MFFKFWSGYSLAMIRKDGRLALDPVALAILGRSNSTVYQLQNGEFHKAIAADDKSLFVILIGSNIIGSGHLLQPTTCGILAKIWHLLSHIPR